MVVATNGVTWNSARFWSAPVLWRFGSEWATGDEQKLIISLITPGGKAVEGYRLSSVAILRRVDSPRRSRNYRSGWKSPSGFGVRQPPGALPTGV